MELGNNAKANFTWNMIGSVFESALNFVLLIVVNRVIGESGAGIYTLAFSHAQLMYYIGTLEVRPIHSTDVTQKYRFADYFSLRAASGVLMILVSVVWILLMGGDAFKTRVMIWICLYKVTDIFLDLFTSMFQQHERIEYSGKVSTLHVGLAIPVFSGVLLLTKNLEFASLSLVAVGLLTLFTYTLRKWREFPDAEIRITFAHAKEILIACLPLFVSVFVQLYISNAPKYAIDAYCSDVIQNRYSILFMPAFVINLFSLFVLRPMLTPMARLWNEGRMKQFNTNLRLMILIILGATVLGIGGAWLLGVPVLNLLYGVDLSADRAVLLWVMVYGGLNAFNIFFYCIIATIRAQKWLLIAYGLSAAAVFFLASPMVRASGMTGAVLSSIIAIGLLDAILAVITWLAVRARPEGTEPDRKEMEP